MPTKPHGGPGSGSIFCATRSAFTRGRAPTDKQRRGKDEERYHRCVERPSRRPPAGRRRQPAFRQHEGRSQSAHQMAHGDAFIPGRVRTDRALSSRRRTRAGHRWRSVRHGQSASGAPLRSSQRSSCSPSLGSKAGAEREVLGSSFSRDVATMAVADPAPSTIFPCQAVAWLCTAVDRRARYGPFPHRRLTGLCNLHIFAHAVRIRP